MTTRVNGNLTIKSSNQPTIYGDGTLKLPSTIQFTSDTGPCSITNTGGNIFVSSTNGLGLQAMNGNSSLETLSQNVSGVAKMYAQGVNGGCEILSAGSQGVTVTSNKANAQVLLDSQLGPVNINGNKAVGITSATDSIYLTTTQTDKNINIQGGNTTGQVIADAKTLNLGTSHATNINIGNAATNTTVLGNFTVTGDYTVVNTVNTTTRDNITLHNTPALQASDTGILFERHRNDITAVGQDPNITTTLYQNIVTGMPLTTFKVNIATGSKWLFNCHMRLVNNVTSNSQVVKISDASEVLAGTQDVLVTENILYNFPVADTTVEIFTGTCFGMLWNTALNQLEFFTTNGVSQDLTLNLRYKNLINVACNKVVATDSGRYENVEQVIVGSNSSIAVNIVNTDTRGSFIITVESVETNGAVSIFQCCKARANSTQGQVFRTVSQPGENGESINIVWNMNGKAQLYHDVLRSNSTLNTNLTYNVKVSYV